MDERGYPKLGIANINLHEQSGEEVLRELSVMKRQMAIT